MAYENINTKEEFEALMNVMGAVRQSCTLGESDVWGVFDTDPVEFYEAYDGVTGFKVLKWNSGQAYDRVLASARKKKRK